MMINNGNSGSSKNENGCPRNEVGIDIDGHCDYCVDFPEDPL